jgi:CTP:molybdopterin cytidylyltransferase MocA
MLAAGRGHRFGGDKLRALYRGKPLLSYGLATVESACHTGLLSGGVAVLAANDAGSLELVRATRLEPLINGTPEAGLARSLRLGIALLERETRIQAAMVFLGDQPLVRLDVIGRLISVWRAESAPIVRPRYAARPEMPGHPVLISRQIWHRVHQLAGDVGLSAIPSADGQTLLVDVPGDNPDVDTMADLRAIEPFPA